ncbi:MAG: hypothetical protein U5R06_07890 [candidate division KSB1 bacterium]|nr:hypothetical protein [candidate division KSB1 bacterium]
MVSEELLNILACPSCKGDLEYNQDQDTLICRSRHCPTCGMPVDASGTCQNTECGVKSDAFVGLIYHVQDDIPNMLIYEADKFPLNQES